MTLTLVLGSVAVIGAFVLLWSGVTTRPSAARANLFAGLAEPPAAEPKMRGSVRKLGEATRRLLPNAMVDGLEVRLVQAGHPHGLDLPRILGVKAALAAVGFLIFIINGNLVFALGAAVLLFFTPDYYVASEKTKRHAALQADIADTVDQLTICVEAGLGLDAALARVAATAKGPMAQELRHTMSDIQAGVPRAQALRALSDRAQIDEIRQLVSALLQALKRGVPIAEILRVQSTEMRTKRKQRTEEKAAKLTVKMIFPIVVCYLPVFIIIAVLPSVMSIFEAI